jgi:hypothetical protein
MRNDFAERINKIELELLALKTSALYTSTRNTVTTFSGRVSTGTYRITYASSEGVISEIFSDRNKQANGGVYPKTPSGNVQDVEVNTTYGEMQEGSLVPVTYDTSFVVVSTVPVVSIVRL